MLLRGGGGVTPALQLPADRLRETQAASRPAHPSCLCLSCSTATLTAVFPLIRDGTSLHLATSSLPHHLFFPLSGTKPSAARPPWASLRLPPPHLERMRRERSVILGFKRPSRPSCTPERTCGFLLFFYPPHPPTTTPTLFLGPRRDFPTRETLDVLITAPLRSISDHWLSEPAAPSLWPPVRGVEQLARTGRQTGRKKRRKTDR